MLKGVTPSGRRERFIEPDKGRILSEICPVVNSPIEYVRYNESACSCIGHKVVDFSYIGEKCFDKVYPLFLRLRKASKEFLHCQPFVCQPCLTSYVCIYIYIYFSMKN